MQYIPGSSVTLSASLSYLAKNPPLPDDSDVQTRIPQICVDYLSHEWLEEDVWKSWRNMTRHKNEVTNGVRLENASWRTWWKQRNKLRTISPETLNWLKDSDVTWLYGPLHTAAEPVPPPKQSTTEDRFNLVTASGKKPILKHRTISELLNIPVNNHSPLVVPQSIGSPALEAVSMGFGSPSEGGSREASPRPHLPHTKSDSHIIAPRVTLTDPLCRDGDGFTSRSMSPAHSDGLANSVSNLTLNTPAKRHISFNTFVEQCISIDDPAAAAAAAQAASAYDESDEGVVDDDDEEDEDDSSISSVLEMHATPAVGARRPNERASGPMLRSNSTSQERERMTIAPIPPTSLKTSGDFPAPSPQVVYAPPKEFLWELPAPEFPSSSSESTASSDNLSSASGGITGQSLDLGFVAPQWGRPAPPPGSVGSGSTGPVGPDDLFQANVYNAVGYEAPARAAVDPAAPVRGIGLHAGRSKWVPGSAVPDDEEEEEEEEAEDEEDGPADDSSDALSGAEDTDDVVAEGKPSFVSSPPSVSTVVSESSSSTTSDARTVIGPSQARSPPSSVRSGSSRGASSQPGKSILKNAAAGGVNGSVGVGAGSDDPSSGASHSNPIGIPKASIAHPPPPPPPSSSGKNGYFQLPPTATISSVASSAGFLSPTQTDVIFFGSPTTNGGVVGGGSTGRGRTSTRSASSASGISDRSRSSSKISGTSSPLGSVSPSGYGSPAGSRASSVLGNRRSSTDVGVAVGRSAAAGVGASGRTSLRQASTSPPSISSPLVNSTIPTSSLGTIVANVPLDVILGAEPPQRGGPPLSRSGRSNSKIIPGQVIVAPARPRLGSRTNSGSSVSSSGSSGSSSGTANAPRTPKDNVSIILPPAPLPVQAVTKKSSMVLPIGDSTPHVIISPSTGGVNTSASSSAGQSPSGGTTMSLEARDSKLDEAMRMQQANVLDEDSDAGETDTGTFEEYKSTNPTPSNSPMMGLAKVLSSSSSSNTITNATSASAPVTSPKRGVVSPGPKSSPSSAVITPTLASAPALTPTDENGIVGKTADTLVSGAKGLLGAIWGKGDGPVATPQR